MCIVYGIVHTSQIGHDLRRSMLVSIPGNRGAVVTVNIPGSVNISIKTVRIGKRRRVDAALLVHRHVPVRIYIAVDCVFAAVISDLGAPGVYRAWVAYSP